MAVQEKYTYGLIGYEYVNLIKEKLPDFYFALTDGPVSLDKFEENFDNIKKDADFIDRLIFDVTYIQEDEDYFQAIDYIKRRVEDNDMRIIVIDPFNMTKDKAEKIISAAVYDIITLNVSNSYIDFYNKEAVRDEISYQIDYHLRNPSRYSDAKEALQMYNPNPVSLMESENQETKEKPRKKLFGGKKDNNKKDEKQESSKKDKERKYSICLVSKNSRFETKLKDASKNTSYNIVKADDYTVPEECSAVIFEGDFDDIDLENYEIPDIPVFLVNNGIIDSEDLEDSIYELDADSPQEVIDELNSFFKTSKKKTSKSQASGTGKASEDSGSGKKLSFGKIVLGIVLAMAVLLVLTIVLFLSPLRDTIINIFSNPENIQPTITEIAFKDGNEIELSYADEFNYKNYIAEIPEDFGYSIEIDEDELASLKEIGDKTVTLVLKFKDEEIDTKEMTVHVIDDVKPDIKLKENKIEIGDADDFVCEDYIIKAEDEIDGDLTESVKCSSILDKDEKEQDVEYSVSDSSDNKATEVLTIVLNEKLKPEPTPTSTPAETEDPGNDKPEPTETPGLIPISSDPPEKKYITVSEMKLPVGSSKDDIENLVQNSVQQVPGAGSFRLSINYSEVDTTKAGEYTVTYSVSDSDGKLLDTVEQKLTVYEKEQ